MTKNIEVEVRGLLKKEEYISLMNFLDKNANSKTLDDRQTTFFIIPNKTLKITRNLLTNKAKISLKIGDISTNFAQEEIELDIDSNDFETAIEIFKNLGFTKLQNTTQKRTNYNYKDTDFAIKWSKDWGYHFELELMVATEDQIITAHTKLLQTAKELKLTVMTAQEMSDFCKRVDTEHNSNN